MGALAHETVEPVAGLPSSVRRLLDPAKGLGRRQDGHALVFTEIKQIEIA